MKRAARNEHVWGQPDTLDELRFHWGGAYDIAASGETFTARRRDGRGDLLADPLPEGLRRLIRADGEWQAWHLGAQDHEMLAGATPEELNAAIRADTTHRSAL
jgi:hypothetical protein